MEKPVSKLELMEYVYSPAELKNIDSAIPIELWDEHPPVYHVMNYNKDAIFGRCENLFRIAEKRGLNVPSWFKKLENYRK